MAKKPTIAPRKPKRGNAKARAAFVTGAQAPGRPGARVFKRQDGRQLKRIGVYIPVDLAKSLQLHCVEEECDASDAVTKALLQYL